MHGKYSNAPIDAQPAAGGGNLEVTSTPTNQVQLVSAVKQTNPIKTPFGNKRNQ
jgi:hypothetical protein